MFTEDFATIQGYESALDERLHAAWREVLQAMVRRPARDTRGPQCEAPRAGVDELLDRSRSPAAEGASALAEKKRHNAYGAGPIAFRSPRPAVRAGGGGVDLVWQLRSERGRTLIARLAP